MYESMEKADPEPVPLAKEPTPLEEAVINFYLQDDVSWTSPGRKDTIKLSANQIVSKRYLLQSVEETYAMYKLKHQEDTNIVQRSKFYSLRPKQVLLNSKIPHNVCTCKYHENMRFLLEVLSKHTRLPASFSEISASMTCDEMNEECILRKCVQCHNKIDTFILSEETAVEPAKWSEWTNNHLGHMDKIIHEDTVGKAYEIFAERVDAFLLHQYIKRRQSEKFEMAKQEVNDKSAVLQVDYAENFSVVIQDEVQSRHWVNEQISLFTAYAWMTPKRKSYSFLSDELEHSKYSVATCIERIFENMISCQPTINTLIVFSDGAASQFKNRFLVNYLELLREKFKLKTLEWHFFATSHGKGVVDGIGGTVKNVARRQMLSKVSANNVNLPINNAASFITKVQPLTVVELSEYKSADVRAMEELFQKHQIHDAPNITGIQSLHSVKLSANTTLVSMTAISSTTAIELITKADTPSNDDEHNEPSTSTEINVHSIIAIAYEDGFSLGEVVLKVDNDEWKVKLMEKSTNGAFKWTKKHTTVHRNFVMATSPLLEPRDASLRAFTLTNAKVVEDVFFNFKKEHFLV